MATSASPPTHFQSSFKTRLGNKRSAYSPRPSVEMPDCLNGEEEEDIDATGTIEAIGPAQVQQSLYGLIRAAGGQFGAVFESGIASDSENDTEVEDEGKNIVGIASKPSQATGCRSSLADQRRDSQTKSSLRRKGKLQAQTPMKQIRESKELHSDDTMSQSQFLPPRETTLDALEWPASASTFHEQGPVLNRRLKPRAKADVENAQTSLWRRRSREELCKESATDKKPPSRLPVAVADVFGFDELEQSVVEYPCWFLQNVLLEGYFYITSKHVCFYAYLPKKRSTAIKSGNLSKQGKRNPRYRRYWFELKGDVLSYFASATDPYFPSGAIDLRYGISAEIDQEDTPTTAFTVTTPKGTYHFKADSAPSAKEWVKQLQKVIFRSRNDGDSVKIVLPITNIVDAESNAMMGRQDTIRLRVIDNAETYAVDEYFFTFLKHGQAVLDTIKGLIENNGLREVAVPAGQGMLGREVPDPAAHLSLKDHKSTDETSDWSPRDVPPVAYFVRSTVSRQSLGSAGGPGPQASGEYGLSSGEGSRAYINTKRTGADRGRQSPKPADRRNVYGTRHTSNSPMSSSTEESSESFFTSSDQVEGPPDLVQIDMTASQMLGGDRAFKSPTLRMSQHHFDAPLHHQHLESGLSIAKSSTRTPTDQDISIGSQHAKDARLFETPRRPSLTPLGGMSMRILATPLQQAFNLYDSMRTQSKRGLSYLSGSPKEYYSKFSEAIAGGQRHYSDLNGMPEDRIDDPEQDLDASEHQRRFQEHFALPKSERLLAVFYCWLHRVLPLYGKIYIGEHFFCFRSLIYGTRTKLKVAFKNMLNVEKEKGFRWKFPGMVVALRGREELFFDFTSNGLRDDCVVSVLRCLDNLSMVQSSVLLTDDEKKDAQKAAAENERLEKARKDYSSKSHMAQTIDTDALEETEAQSILFDDTEASVLDFKPTKPLRITCLTIGSRGDVQPYIALCKGLIADGHKVRIATHHEFGPWVKQYGIDFVPVDGDPAELMRLCVENGMFTPSFIFEVNFKFRGWLDKLLNSSYEACKGSDLLIDSPSTMAGIHIAEALGIPYFRAFTMPWTRTRAYPHAFAVPGHKRGGGYNYMTYMMFDNLFWQITAGQINRWRRKTLGLKPTSLEKLQVNKVPFLYNFSPSVVVPPLDFSDWIRVTGYWFLDEGKQYVPPADLVAFINKAHEDKAKLVYIGFGSITVSDSKVLTQQVVGAVRKAGVRCILSKGWSDRLSQSKLDPTVLEVPLPPEVFQIKSVPHDWLFTQVDACVHHGGAGTTGASLRAGKPTVIKPFFGDQNFFATRVEDLGVGIRLEGITINSLGRAVWIATHEVRMRDKARALGEQIRREDGVGTAIKAIYRDLEYAKTLIKRRDQFTADEGADAENAEEWVYVEDNVDIDLTGT